MLVEAGVAKYADHLPLYRQETIFERPAVVERSRTRSSCPCRPCASTTPTVIAFWTASHACLPNHPDQLNYVGTRVAKLSANFRAEASQPILTTCMPPSKCIMK